MKFPMIPRRKADAISNGVLLIALGILLYTGAWWPGILFVIAAVFAVRQFLSGRKIEFFVTMTVFIILSLVTFAGAAIMILMPLFLILAGLYVIGREYFSYDSNHFNR